MKKKDAHNDMIQAYESMSEYFDSKEFLSEKSKTDFIEMLLVLEAYLFNHTDYEGLQNERTSMD